MAFVALREGIWNVFTIGLGGGEQEPPLDRIEAPPGGARGRAVRKDPRRDPAARQIERTSAHVGAGAHVENHLGRRSTDTARRHPRMP